MNIVSKVISKAYSILKFSKTATSGAVRMTFNDYLLSQRKFDLAAAQSLYLYKKCSPLADAVDRVVNAARDVKPVLFNEKTRKFKTSSSLLDLLKNPSFGATYQKFLQQLLTFLIITGDSFVMANSIGVDREPVVLRVVPPQCVSTFIGVDGFVETYTVDLAFKSIVYKRVRDKYFADINGVSSELLHFSCFNPNCESFNVRGYSILNPLFYEIEQYCAASIHNLSLLKRGMTLGGLFLFDDILTTEKIDILRSNFNEYYSGEESAGKPLVLDNARNLRYIQTYAVTKDMDFETLKSQLTVAIYNKLKIPQPKVSKETMTMTNMDIAQEAFYDDAVFPWLNDVLASLTLFLRDRYKELANSELSYDRNTIPALESRNIDALVNRNKINALTKNELRESMGYSKIKEGADTLYQEANLIPISTESSDNDNDNDNDNNNNNNNEDDE